MFSADIQEQIALEVISLLASSISFVPTHKARNAKSPFSNIFSNAVAKENRTRLEHLLDFEKIDTFLADKYFKKLAYILSGGDERSLGLDDLGVDVFIDDDLEITAIQLETAFFLHGGMKGQKQSLLELKNALVLEYPNRQIHCYLGIPFAPYSENPTDCNKIRFLDNVKGGQHFTPEEILLGGEFWEFLSGEKDAMQQILNIIETVATPDFVNNYFFLKNSANRETHPEKYKEKLKQWFLFSELDILNSAVFIIERAGEREKRIYNQNMFQSSGDYNWNRCRKLAYLIQTP